MLYAFLLVVLGLPLVALPLPPIYRDLYIVLHDFIFEFLSCAVLVHCLREANSRESRNTLKLFLAAMIFLTIADLMYVTGFGSYRFPGQELIAEGSFSIYFSIILVLLAKRFFVNLNEPKRTSMIVFSVVFVFFLILQIIYVVIPLSNSTPPFSWSLMLNYYFYSVVSAAVSALAVMLSVRTFCFFEFIYVQSLLLKLIFDFSLTYKMAIVQYEEISSMSLGWSTAIGGIFVAIFFSWKKGRLMFTDLAPLSEWNSIRTLLGTFVFAVNLLLLIGITLLSFFLVKNAFQLTALLFLVFACWTTSNALALYVSTNILKLNSLMPVPQVIDGTSQNLQSLLLPTVRQKTLLAELDQLISSYNGLVIKTNAYLKALVEKNRDAAIGKHAAQVAHDIRSPLTALNVVLPELNNLPEEHRLLARSSIFRIQDIAHSLLNFQMSETKLAESSLQDRSPSVMLIIGLIDSLISEKRIQYRSRLGIRIEGCFGPNSYGLFAKIQPVEFGRVLSNLINNAVESMGVTGLVQVEVEASSASRILLKIKDNGKGISPEVLAAMHGNGDIPSTKHERKGLGVHHARTVLQSFQGQLAFESQLLVGSTAVIELPRVVSPSWFLENIDLRGIFQVIILDDDLSIHQIWNERFSGLAEHSFVQLVHLSTPNELRQEISNQRRSAASPNQYLHLIDYEFLGFSENGVSLIQELELSNHSVLVTSHFEDLDVIAQCAALGIKLIPKSAAALVPIVI